ncbi:1,4-beta-xylanase [Cohnella sp. CIP 111063]|uniref:endo-1,4-beta-xylanase n=1 Tax=unclassified Cohnella TaxID=2636738 RepID=UPI000B8C20B7|nr:MULTISPECIES: endo-1,4-beta-xylanase [unclassified Cohnella]OXS58407.1 1,4-beta-xylanase [Cohnella sp. CIP 111063]PRX71695.1 endo-1,4-beta-xylanase [Cohnella sp. SGD-V74]
MVKKFRKFAHLLLASALLVPSGWLAPVARADGGEAAADTTIYHETFAEGAGAAAQAGGASLTPVTGKAFDGNDDGAALYVSNRANNWDAADFGFGDIGLENGKTYTVTVSGYIDENETVPAGAQAYLQTVDSYGWLAGADLVAGAAFSLTREFTVDTSKDRALRVQSNDNGASVPFYIGDIRITEKTAPGEEEENPRPPALEFAAITFEDETAGGFAGRAGTETLTVTDEANHTEGGSYALKVEGRTGTWHGPALRVEKYVDKGREYKVTAWVKLIEPASSQLQLSTQVGDGSSANYVQLSAKTINAADGWVQFEGSYRYNNVSSEFLTIYLESSNNATASFYIDDIGFEPTGSGPSEIQKDLTPIKDAYQESFLIGNAISAEDLEGVRLELLKMHHNAATAGNAMKPDALQPSKGNFTFETADALVDKVLEEGMQMHGHVLVWHQQSPPWMNTADGNPLSREEALDNLRTHIRTVMEHFGDRVISWDVVNEAMNDNPPEPADWQASLRQTPWYRAIGPDYVEQAFLAAREVLDEHPEWDIKLYYNDYNEDNQNKAQAIYNMVKDINDRYALDNPDKLLIDGVGMQGHYNVNTNPENVKLSLEKFISLGVEVSITELDVQAGSNYELSERLANAQGYLYARLFELFKAHASDIKRVTFWGLDDNTSWRASSNPLLFDKNLQAKPAYYGVIDPEAFIAEHEPESTDANQSIARFGTPKIDGAADQIWSLAPEMPISRYQTAWHGATGTAKALWDDRHLYVLIRVSDAQLDKSNANVWEQDSVEVFLDENNGKTSFYQSDDGQFRINFDNETSFNPPGLGDGFESAVQVSGTNYTVEMKIPFKTITPGNDVKLGFDAQINDAKDGARQSVAAWNDTTGTGYMDPSVFGVLTLVGKVDNGGGNNGGGTPSMGAENGRIKPEIKNENGRAIAAVSYDSLKKALEQAVPAANGAKHIVIELTKQADTTTYEAQLPTRILQSEDNFLLSVQTPYATLQLPGGLLSGAGVDTEHVSVRVAEGSRDKLDAATRERIGNHPLIELSLTANGEEVAWGSGANVTVSVPYTPTAEERLNPERIVVWYIDGEGRTTAIPNGRYDAATGTVVFRTSHFSTYAAAFVFATFEDVRNVPWAKQAIEVMASREIVQGEEGNRFSPASSVSRADFVALLVKTLELPNADDLNNGGGANANGSLSRQDMIVLTRRALEAAGKPLEAGGSLDAFSDAASMTGDAKTSAEALVKAGVINGKNGKIAPKDALTRAEAAVILYRIWKL